MHSEIKACVQPTDHFNFCSCSRFIVDENYFFFSHSLTFMHIFVVVTYIAKMRGKHQKCTGSLAISQSKIFNIP